MIQNIRATGWLVARGSFTPSCGMGDFKKLLVWQKAHAMALDAHRVVSRILSLLSVKSWKSQKMLYGLRRYLASRSKDSKQA
ncbi:MAG: hypothetical protein ABR543_13150 [Gemmatimonadaceae bacterium]